MGRSEEDDDLNMTLYDLYKIDTMSFHWFNPFLLQSLIAAERSIKFLQHFLNPPKFGFSEEVER